MKQIKLEKRVSYIVLFLLIITACIAGISTKKCKPKGELRVEEKTSPQHHEINHAPNDQNFGITAYVE